MQRLIGNLEEKSEASFFYFFIPVAFSWQFIANVTLLRLWGRRTKPCEASYRLFNTPLLYSVCMLK